MFLSRVSHYWVGHAKPEISDLCSTNQFFSPRSWGRRSFPSPILSLSFFRPRTYPKGYYFYYPQSSSVIKSKMAATTIRIWTSFRPPKIRLYCRLSVVVALLVVIAFEVRERNPWFVLGVMSIFGCPVQLKGRFFRDCIRRRRRHTFASLWGACLRFASLWRANSLGDSCVLGLHLSNVCWGKSFIF